MRSRRAVFALAGIAALLLPGACSTLPTSGEPHEFGIETPQREPLRQFGSAPQPGSAPTVLVEDFLRASAAGMYDDFATARLYLTEDANAVWRPDVQVAIFGPESTPEPEIREHFDDEVEVALELTTVGTVSELGVLSASDTPGSASRTFTLIHDSEGEWRIDSLDDGVILSQASFLNAYQAANLYFPSTDLSGLVADPRWYPRTRLPSYLVKGLIDGPVPDLDSAVTGNLAANLTLPTAGVDVVSGTTTVNLEGRSSAQEEDRVALVWQIEQTLRQVPSVQEIAIRLNGVELEDSQVPVGPKYRLDRAVGLLDGAVVTMAGRIPVADAEVVGADAAFPAIGPVESSPVAWVTPSANRLSIVMPDSIAAREVPVEQPSAPSVDRYGTVWVASTVAGGDLWAVPANADPVTVPVPMEGPISKVAVSPDGSRIAILVEADAGPAVWLGTIGRTANEGGYTLSEVTPVTQFPDEVLDITWAGDTTIAALVAGEGEDRTVEIHSIGGWPMMVAAPADAVHVTAAGAVGSLVVQRDDGVAFQRAGAAWIELSPDLRQLSFAG